MLKKFSYDTELGKIWITENKNKICGVLFSDEFDADVEETCLIYKTYLQIEEYLKGERKVFDIPLDFNGTNFQRKVWQALLNINYGETISYLQLAQQIGESKACRAVGNANRKNKILILIPCHRVISANNTLSGYIGGVDKKKFLLNLEKLNV